MKRITAVLSAGLLASSLLGAGAGLAGMGRGSAAPGDPAIQPGSTAGRLIRGLDGAVYSRYRTALVQKTQDSLKQAGLYAGPRSGMLDEATMKALGEFQRQHHIAVTGVPTPITRRELFRESAGATS